MFNKYGISGTLYLALSYLRTKLIFRNARLIRFPIDIRGKQGIQVGTGFTTGRNCRLEALAEGENKGKYLIIGDNVQMNDNVHITACEAVTIGNDVLIASKVYISDVSHGSYSGIDNSSPQSAPAQRPLVTKPVIIHDNVWLGDGVCILPGVTIGYGCVIGANAVVNKSIPPLSIAAGIPARVIKSYSDKSKKWEQVG